MANKRIGLVTGVFDLLHRGHEQLIKQALKRVDLLYVGIETDKRVRQLKGEQRPFHLQEQRRQRLQKLFPQIVALILPENFGEITARRAWIEGRGVTVLLVASEDERIESKRQLMRELGGAVEIIEGLKNEGRELVSMSKILQKKQSWELLIFAEDKKLLEGKS